MPSAVAIFAHPDDIEFVAAGTLILLKKAGWDIHYLNLSAGDGGSLIFDSRQTAKIRLEEGKSAAQILGARFHPPISRDLQIFYDQKHLRQLVGIIREINPSVVLTHSPEDYMEDHMTTSRLAVTAAFAKGIPNFGADPPVPPPEKGADITVYHAMPHGLRDPLRRRIIPGACVDTTAVHTQKREALAAHQSQKDWLDQSQGMDSYLVAMDEMSEQVGALSGKFKHAEGWRRHLHLGFSKKEIDPLAEALGKNYLVNQAYEDALERGERPRLEN